MKYDVAVIGGGVVGALISRELSVSYTHLDVYKRQGPDLPQAARSPSKLSVSPSKLLHLSK